MSSGVSIFFVAMSALLRCEDTSHGSATDVEAPGDLGFAEAGAAQFADLIGVQCCGCGPAQTLAVQPGMSESSPYAFTEDLALEASEDGQASWRERGEI